MRFKLIIAFVDDITTDNILDAAREAGATGATVINHARGEGLKKKKTFMGLGLDVQRDVILWLVEEHMSRHILETICEVGGFNTNPGQGIAIQIDVEDAVGVAHQVEKLTNDIKDQI
ncbi:P-II family nitrogen regulator [Shewanella sp. 1_MG-2023]|uniref:P-II family nitrogen regulator n=1 Tax=Shewanella electrodiphila TaxID=934143 RepID=A0ABT0KRC8_9GAMM|nr:MULTISPECIES: P-II family nitrogen regulator [Shewanella]MCC4833028.1 P-II family nitrogen regulator [Shewanella sp. 10N.7]MCL1046410.1 P-II family nitrogen regulator [Shewanella electrodiphila]MDO6610627.1 P-II family nitrogen regulator [Shewanella sp. 7_MG-2023]MDO6770752.1 P-II family nitrogen regulator [Shewanella sp. 2_MG-2023]MDO6793230.1 P-II family nitrogen regulator [Shewanella sp. 1_MG-2023]